MDNKVSSNEQKRQQMELDDIANKITDLDKWRDIFSCRGLELKKAIDQKNQDHESVDEDAKGAGSAQSNASTKQLLFTSYGPHSVPRSLVVSSNLGGRPITKEMAVELRKTLFGNIYHVFNYEWKISYFKFCEPHSRLAYALEAEKGGARAIQMAVQAHIINYLLFIKNNVEHSSVQRLYEISKREQERALAAAMADILWTAGEGQQAIICLVSDETNFTQGAGYKTDNFTEKLLLFEFTEVEALQKFVCDHILCFKSEGSHGVILFLYSLVFSRTFGRLHKDLDFTTPHLLQFSLGNLVCTQAAINLILTGRASPHVFNGDQILTSQGDEEGPLMHGVHVRSDVGFLRWCREEMDKENLPKVGSMLKTPKLPVWLCYINGTYSVLFSTNRSLLSDWKMEHLFELYFYNGQPSQHKTAHLTVNTQSHRSQGRQQREETEVEKRFSYVDMTIRSKWHGATINWKGTVPFF